MRRTLAPGLPPPGCGGTRDLRRAQLAAPMNAQHQQLRFADALEHCIRNAAAEAAATVPRWGDACMPPTQKIDLQAEVLDRTLSSIHNAYGYTGALWCAFYSVRMTGAEYDPADMQPNNPNIFDWYDTLLCPWNVDDEVQDGGNRAPCGHEELGKHGNEWGGVPAQWSQRQNAQYLVNPADPYVQNEPDRRTMSCGLCGHLKRQLGPPPFTVDPPAVDDPGREDMYTANMDFHPFGAWLANNAVRHGRSVGEIVRLINVWRASNGEEIHGYLWQSLRLLAYDTGSLSGTRREVIDDDLATGHAMRVCEPAWSLAPQSRDDCAHAAGHGFFYHFLDIGRAVTACWTDKMVDHTPCGTLPCREVNDVEEGEEQCISEEGEAKPKAYGIEVGTIECGDRPDVDADWDTRSSGLNPQDMLKWRWLCATGVFHASGNTLSVEALQRTIEMESTAEELLCRRSNLWGDDTPYFDRCAAGLGMKETEKRLTLVKEGKCDGTSSDGRPAAWEIAQCAQCTLQPIEPARRQSLSVCLLPSQMGKPCSSAVTRHNTLCRPTTFAPSRSGLSSRVILAAKTLRFASRATTTFARHTRYFARPSSAQSRKCLTS